MENYKISLGKDGIAIVTWDMPNRSMNVLSESSIREMIEWIEQLAGNADVKGIVLTSGKENFCAGADLSMLEGIAGSGLRLETASEAERKTLFENSYALNKMMRRLETCGKPIVAAMPGTALGGGLEIALACHYRIVATNPSAKFGLPEAQVGVMPGGGGTQRLPRLIGVQAALPLMLQGRMIDAESALKQGILHKIVAPGELVEEAKAWINAGGSAVQPWDTKEFKVPGGGPYHPKGIQNFLVGNAMLRKETYGNYPAANFIMQAVYEGIDVPIDAGLKIESTYFSKLMMLPSSKNMIRSLFISKQELDKGARRPTAEGPTNVKRIGMLGAGFMGAGIAYVSAMAGIEVVLLDMSMEGAEKGKSYSTGLLDKSVGRGKMTEAEKEAVLKLIKPTTDYADLKDCDLIIEAVFEDRSIKAEVTKKTEAVIRPDVIYGSNTSTLPITGLAEASQRQEQFIGIHFFSPVDKMMLVEIIMGEKTGNRALATALDYVRQIKKTPIVVNDSRGFYTSRCVGVYINEGIRMLTEGVKPALVENAAKMLGMPVGPLALQDEVALDLSHKIRTAWKKDLGDKYPADATDDVIEEMVVKRGRLGRKSKKGFYEYPDGGQKVLWAGISEIADVARQQPPVEEVKTRILYAQAIETVRCFEEGVLTDVRDADLGAILGWGFAPWSGGPLSYIDSIGVKAFVTELERLAKAYGPRFEPTPLLREMAAKGETFYGRFNPKAAKAAE